MSFTRTLRRTIALASERSIEYEKPEQERLSLVQRVFGPRSNAEGALDAYLDSLDRVSALKLMSLMYAGRGDGDILELYADFAAAYGDETPESHRLSEKAPLARYLSQGLEQAAGANLDLEADWEAIVKSEGLGPREPKRRREPSAARRPSRDPIGEGAEIFADVAGHWPEGVILPGPDISKFFDLLAHETAGAVIVDFIDQKNWDSLTGYSYDEASHFLELYWHDYRALDTEDGPPDSDTTFFPLSLYALLVRVREIQIVPAGRTAFFAISGYSLSRNELRDQLAVGATEYQCEQEGFFSTRCVRRLGKQVHQFRVMDTPLYTTLIAPKMRWLDTELSRYVMYEVNLARVASVVERATLALRTHWRLEGVINEKANTIRRSWEQALKIEVLYRGIQPEKAYAKLRLGDLLSVLRGNGAGAAGAGRVIRLANEFSHDAGTPTRVEDALEMATFVQDYISQMTGEIRRKVQGR